MLGFDRVDDNAPLFAFVFLVALGVDYNIFLVTRALEESRGHGSREGMLRGLAATGGVITSAGILLAAVFAVLGVLPLVVLAQLGIIVGIGVLLDTLLVRTVLVPALALLLGDRFWWPRAVGTAEPQPAVALRAVGPGPGQVAERVGVPQADRQHPLDDQRDHRDGDEHGGRVEQEPQHDAGEQAQHHERRQAELAPPVALAEEHGEHPDQHRGDHQHRRCDGQEGRSHETRALEPSRPPRAKAWRAPSWRLAHEPTTSS